MIDTKNTDITVSTWEEFIDRLTELQNDRNALANDKKPMIVSNILYRGQENSTWKIQSTLERHVINDISLINYNRLMNAALPRITAFTGEKWQLKAGREYADALAELDPLFMSSMDIPGFEFMLYLRHYGFPSPIVDWSTSVYIAAYFAFRNLTSTADHVSIYALIQDMGEGRTHSTNHPLIVEFGEYIATHRRHFLQQSNYTLCLKYNDNTVFFGKYEDIMQWPLSNESIMWKFNIPSSERKKVLTILNSYNLNAHTLFNSEESLMETIAVREILIKDRF